MDRIAKAEDFHVAGSVSVTLLWQWASVRDRKHFGLFNLISPPATICKQWKLRSETERKLGNSVFFRWGKGKYWIVYCKNSVLGVRWPYPSSWRFWAVSSCDACRNTSVTWALKGLTRKGLAKSPTYPLRNRSSCPGDCIWFMSRGHFYIQWPQSAMSFHPSVLSRLRFTVLHHTLSSSSAKQPALTVWLSKEINYCIFPHPRASRISVSCTPLFTRQTQSHQPGLFSQSKTWPQGLLTKGVSGFRVERCSNLLLFEVCHRELRQPDSRLEGGPPDRWCHSEEQEDDSGFSGCWFPGDRHRSVPQSHAI